MERLGIVTSFWNNKTKVMDYALEENLDVMFMDCDLILVESLNIQNKKLFKLGLSPQFIPQPEAQSVGYYNGGFVWTRCKKLPSLWRHANKTSRYVDQASLEVLALLYNKEMFEFDEGNNIQPWREILWSRYNLDYLSNLLISNGIHYINFKPIRSFHTHFHDTRFTNFNQFVRNYLKGMADTNLYNYVTSILGSLPPA